MSDPMMATDYDLNWWPPLTGGPCPVCNDTTLIRQHGTNQPNATRWATHASGQPPCLFPEPGTIYTTRDGTWSWRPGPELTHPEKTWLIWSHKHDAVNTASEVARTLRCVHCTTVDDDEARACACKCVTQCGSFRCTVKAPDGA